MNNRFLAPTVLVKNATYALVCLFSLFATIQLVRGFWLLGWAERVPTDMFLRWREIHYVFQGRNPYYLSESMWLFEQKAGPRPNIEDYPLGLTSVGSGYPPWAFSLGAILIPPLPFPVSRAIFFILNLGALTYLIRQFWRLMPAESNLNRTLLVSAGVSASAYGTTLGNGQWGLLLLVFAMGAINARPNMRSTVLSGVSLAFLCIKPTFSFSVFALILGRGRFWVAFVTLLVLCASCFLTWLLVDTPPWTMVGQMLEQANRWDAISYSIPDYLVRLGWHQSVATFLCLAVGAAFCFFTAEKIADSFDAVSIALAVGRLFAYHQMYDNLMVALLPVALFRIYFKTGRFSIFLLACAVAFSLLLPGRFTYAEEIRAFQLSSWILGIGAICKFSLKPQLQLLSFNDQSVDTQSPPKNS